MGQALGVVLATSNKCFACLSSWPDDLKSVAPSQRNTLLRWCPARLTSPASPQPNRGGLSNPEHAISSTLQIRKIQVQVTAVACPRNQHLRKTRTPLSFRVAVFLCLEQMVDLLPVITRRVQPIGERGIEIDCELDARLVADLGNLCAICQHRQPGSAERGAEITICRQALAA